MQAKSATRATLARKALSLVLSMLLLTSYSLSSAGSAYAAAVIGGFQGTSVDYNELDATPVLIAPGITITDAAGYNQNSYLEVEATNAKATEVLDVQRVADVSGISKVSGEVSIYQNLVYLGNGSGYDPIAAIDSQFNGQNGKKLRISFSRELENANFNDGPVHTNFDDADTQNPTNSLPGWVVEQGTFNLTDAGLNQRSLGNPITISGSGPYTVTGPNGSYTYTTGFDYGSDEDAWKYESVERIVGSLTTTVQIVTNEGGTGDRALQLTSRGSVERNNGSPAKYGSHFGPVVKSAPFRAKAGDTLSLDWKARFVRDHYEVYGYIQNVQKMTYNLLFYSRGENQDWTTSTGVIPEDGEYRFIFINGTYDKTGGFAVGSNMWIDNIKVYGETYQDRVVEKIARLVTYRSEDKDPPATRAVGIKVVNKNLETSSATATININNRFNHPPTFTATALNPATNNSGTGNGKLFQLANATAVEADQLFTELRLAVTSLKDGPAEKLTIDGTDVSLTDGTAGTTAGNAIAYAVSATADTATISLTHAGLTEAQINTLINGLVYKNLLPAATAGNRTVAITYLKDNGAPDTGGRDDNDAVLDVKSTVTLSDLLGPSGYQIILNQPFVNSKNEKSIRFSFNGAEVGATYSYTITSSGGGTPVTGTGTVGSANEQISGIDTNSLRDGTLTLSVSMTDASGNTSNDVTATFKKDTTLPILDSLTRNTSDWTRSNVTVTAAYHDLAGTVPAVKYVYGKQPVSYFETGGGIVVTDGKLIADQNGTYTVYIEDEAGNGIVGEIEITNIDKGNPTNPTIVKTPDSSFHNDDYTISMIPGTDTLSGVMGSQYMTVTRSVYQSVYGPEEKIETKGWFAYTGPFTVSASGTTEIFVKTTDNAGNESEVVKSQIAINRNLTVAASVAVTPDKEYSNQDYTVSISTRDLDSTVTESVYATIYYKYTGMNDFVPYSGPFTIHTEGKSDIIVKAFDRYGNAETVTRTVYLDKTPPGSQNTVLNKSVVVAAKDAPTIPVQPTGDDSDTIWIAPIGTTVFTEGSTMTKVSGNSGTIPAPAADGEYVVYVIDRAGNVSQPSAAKITVDRTPPVVTGVEHGKTYKSYPVVTFPHGATATLNGKAFASGDEVKPNGVYTLMVTDEHGNQTILTFTVDNDTQTVDESKQALAVVYQTGDRPERVTKDVTLPTAGKNGTTVTWKSSHPEIMGDNGKIVSHPSVNTTVTLTATITKGDATETKPFTVVVYADVIPPAITLLGDSVITLTEGQLYVENGFTARDNTDGDVTSKVVREGTINTKQAGTYKLVYKVTDESGNVTTVERMIIVKAKQPLTGAIVTTDNGKAVADADVAGAIDAAKRGDSSDIKIKVNSEVTKDNPIYASISKDQVTSAKNNRINLIFETDNASIEVPMRAVDPSRMGTNSRLELVIEKLDIEKAGNKEMVDAVKKINPSLSIYNGNVYDYKMKIVEKDQNGNTVKDEVITNFRSEEDITLRIFIGTGHGNGTAFMTFYYNETTKEWEYIRGKYEAAAGAIKLLTNHLSIYSVMHMTKEQKLAELTNLINKNNITVAEVLNIIEDEDVAFEQKPQYKDFYDEQKEDVAEKVIGEKPGSGYSNYDQLKNKLNESVLAVYQLVNGDRVAPVIKLKGTPSIWVTKGQAYVEPGAVATDNLEGDITGRIIVYGTVNPNVNGPYTLRYTIKDLAGNTAEIARTVTVYESSIEESEPTPPKKPDPQPAKLQLEVIKGQESIIAEKAELPASAAVGKGMSFVSDAFALSAKDGRSDASGKIKIKYDDSKVKNEEKLGIFVYDEKKAEWKYVGGKVDKINNEITLDIEIGGLGGKIALIENTVTFHDIQGHWAQGMIELLASRQIIDGDPAGNFNPNKGINRAEFVKIMTKLLKLETGSAGADSGFADVQPSDWYALYISAAKKAGIVNGVSETEFEPSRIVSRQEMTAMVLRAYRTVHPLQIGEKELSQVAKFQDDSLIGDWSKNDVYTAKYLKLVEGRTDSEFVPTSETLRGEAAALIFRLMTALDNR